MESVVLLQRLLTKKRRIAALFYTTFCDVITRRIPLACGGMNGHFG